MSDCTLLLPDQRQNLRPGVIALRFLRPEGRFNAKLNGRFVDNDDIMTEKLTINLVDHRHVRFATNAIPELLLDRRERGFDIAPPVVVRQELLTAILANPRTGLAGPCRSPA